MVLLFVGQVAVVDQEYVSSSRKMNCERRERLFGMLDSLTGYEYLKSESSVFLLRSKTHTADEMEHILVQKGIFVANHNSVTGIKGENFIRLTVQKNEDNNFLINTLKNL